MKKIMAIIPNVLDATSYYRGVGTMSILRKNRPDVDVDFSERVNMMSMMMSDVVFMQRPYKSASLEAARMAKKRNIPLWVDYDDFLFEVPFTNPAYRIYSPEDIKKNIAEIIVMADLVTVSTEFLAECLRKKDGDLLNKNTVVIPNGFNETNFIQKWRGIRDNDIISWRGSNTHDEDLLEVTSQLVELSEKNKNWGFNFIGSKPAFLVNALKGNNIYYTEALSIDDYFEYLWKLQPSVHIVPLKKSRFNLCKSNISWIEATYAGAITVAPDFPEWRKPGIITYEDPKYFKDAVNTALKMSHTDREKYNAISWDHISKNLFSRDLFSRINPAYGSLLKREKCEYANKTNNQKNGEMEL